MFENIEKALTIMLLPIGGKVQTKTQFLVTVTFQRFSKTLSECAMFIRDGRTPT